MFTSRRYRHMSTLKLKSELRKLLEDLEKTRSPNYPREANKFAVLIIHLSISVRSLGHVLAGLKKKLGDWIKEKEYLIKILDDFCRQHRYYQKAIRGFITGDAEIGVYKKEIDKELAEEVKRVKKVLPKMDCGRLEILRRRGGSSSLRRRGGSSSLGRRGGSSSLGRRSGSSSLRRRGGSSSLGRRSGSNNFRSK